MFKIGEFSRLSRVSVRMLRYYDQLGLLKPSQTDGLTNYRYYSADQLARLNRILALQDLGFSLEQIGGLLEDHLSADELRGMLRLKQAEIERGMQEEQRRLSRLEMRLRQLDGGEQKLQHDTIVRSVGSQLVATRREVAADDERIQSMVHEVEAYVAEHERARADKPPFTVYYDAEYREQEIDAEVAVPIRFAIAGSERIQVREMPELPCAACVVHTGGYDSLYQAYNALLGWMETGGYRMAGPMREVYLRYGTDGLGLDLPPTYVAAHGQDYVTELQLPLEESRQDHQVNPQ